MSFLNPTYLWALLGLAVPLAIHLWSKKEGRTIKIGSIRLLRESDPKQTSNLKLNEVLLLLLRLLVIAVLVLILTEPFIKNETANAPLVYLIEPSLLEDNDIRELADSLKENASVKLFSEGFPDYINSEPALKINEIPNYWQITREIENMLADSIVVFTSAFQKGFKGKIPEIGKNVKWILLDPGVPRTDYVEAIRVGDNIELISAKKSELNLGVSKEVFPINSDAFSLNEKQDSLFIFSDEEQIQLPVTTADSIRVTIFYAEDFSGEMRFIKSSFSAIEKYIGRPIEVQTFQKDDSLTSFKPSAVVWLSQETPPQTEVPMLVYLVDSLSEELMIKNSEENLYQLTGKLNSENIITENLAEMLVSMLNLHPGFQEKLQEVDKRVMDREEILPINAGFISEENISGKTDLAKHLWILLLVLLLAERGLARYRKQ